MSGMQATMTLSSPAPPRVHRSETGPGRLAPWQEARAKAVMERHIDGPLPVARVARSCRLSPSYFSRAFKASTGLSPYAWFQARRMRRACELLAGTSDDLADIALACGFSDQSHLTRSFTKHVGVSPGRWRRIATLGKDRPGERARAPGMRRSDHHEPAPPR